MNEAQIRSRILAAIGDTAVPPSLSSDVEHRLTRSPRRSNRLVGLLAAAIAVALVASLAFAVLVRDYSAWRIGQRAAPGSLPIPTANALQISGSLTTDSSREEAGSGRSCVYHAPGGRLDFQTDAMSLEGTAIVRLVITISGGTRVGGQYSATAPLGQYDFTPVRLVTSRTATDGAGNSWNATSGTVTVEGGGHGNVLFFGSVHANFDNGAQVVGGWSCLASQ